MDRYTDTKRYTNREREREQEREREPAYFWFLSLDFLLLAGRPRLFKPLVGWPTDCVYMHLSAPGIVPCRPHRQARWPMSWKQRKKIDTSGTPWDHRSWPVNSTPDGPPTVKPWDKMTNTSFMACAIASKIARIGHNRHVRLVIIQEHFDKIINQDIDQ